MSFITGPGLYRGALAYEILANMASVPLMLFAPEKALLYLVSHPNQITPATKSMMQWFGGLVLAITVPLVLAYPKPAAGKDGAKQVATRRMAYFTLGSMEIAFLPIMMWQDVQGSAVSGLNKTALGVGIGFLEVLVAMRAYFLFWKPEWVEGRESKAREE